MKRIMLAAPSGVLYRYLSGGNWNAKKIRKKGRGSQTPGRSKNTDTCQLTPIGGLPRKAFMRGRSYKYKAYPEWCAKMSGLNL